jgi:hypothetical protein
LRAAPRVTRYRETNDPTEEVPMMYTPRPVSLTEQLEAMPDGGMIPVTFARAAVAEAGAEPVTPEEIREATIRMWVRIGTRHYSGQAVSAEDRARLLEAAR